MQADCFVLPSLFEGSAVSLHEAVGAGLGIIQSEVAGMGAIDGRNGVRIDSVSVDALVDALQLVLADRQRLLEWQQESWAMRSEWTWARYKKRVQDLVGA